MWKFGGERKSEQCRSIGYHPVEIEECMAWSTMMNMSNFVRPCCRLPAQDVVPDSVAPAHAASGGPKVPASHDPRCLLPELHAREWHRQHHTRSQDPGKLQLRKYVRQPLLHGENNDVSLSCEGLANSLGNFSARYKLERVRVIKSLSYNCYVRVLLR